MPHVATADRAALSAYLERAGQETPETLDWVHESIWADFLRDRLTWQPIADAPRDGSEIEVLYDDGTSEHGVEWAETRQCILGSRAGERGAGWISTGIGGLPVGDGPKITHYRQF